VSHPLTVPSLMRRTLAAAAAPRLGASAFRTVVESTAQVVVERATYWPGVQDTRHDLGRRGRPRTAPWRVSVGVALACLGLLPRPAGAQEVIEYYAQDALGSVRVVFNAAGQADYEPFGEAFTWPGAPGGALPAERFTGQERDPEASQDYFGARYYQPRHGRFSQVDPVHAGLFDPQQWNRYAYARNNPVSYVDPDGRKIAGPWCVMLWGKWEVCVGGGGEIGGNGDGGGAGGFWNTDPHRPIFGGGLEGGVDEPQGGGGRVGGTGPGTPQTPPTERTPTEVPPPLPSPPPHCVPNLQSPTALCSESATG
jgi:RHS repeat-associated protein